MKKRRNDVIIKGLEKYDTISLCHQRHRYHIYSFDIYLNRSEIFFEVFISHKWKFFYKVL